MNRWWFYTRFTCTRLLWEHARREFIGAKSQQNMLHNHQMHPSPLRIKRNDRCQEDSFTRKILEKYSKNTRHPLESLELDEVS